MKKVPKRLQQTNWFRDQTWTPQRCCPCRRIKRNRISFQSGREVQPQNKHSQLPKLPHQNSPLLQLRRSILCGVATLSTFLRIWPQFWQNNEGNFRAGNFWPNEVSPLNNRFSFYFHPTVSMEGWWWSGLLLQVRDVATRWNSRWPLSASRPFRRHSHLVTEVKTKDLHSEDEQSRQCRRIQSRRVTFIFTWR